MIVKNEEQLLRRCLDSVSTIADEIIIVDTGSKDRTLEIAGNYEAKIFHCRMGDNFLKARNEYLKKASCDWILTLDADEVIARKDLSRIHKLLLDQKVSGYIFPVRNYINDSNILRRWNPSKGEYPKEEICSGWFLSESLRLFRNQKGNSYEGCLLQPDIRDSILRFGGRIGKCNIPIHHQSFLKYRKFSNIYKKQARYLRISLKSLKKYPRNTAILFNIGNILYRYKQKDRQAATYLKKVIQLRPNFVRSYWLLSLIYQRQKRYQDAEKILMNALRINFKERGLTAYFLGTLYLTQLNLLKASIYFKKAIKLNPDNPTAHNALGVVYEMLAKPRCAVSEYEKSIMLNKKNYEVYENIKRMNNVLK